MTYLKNTVLLASVIATAFLIPVTYGAPYIITDDRVRSLDVTPVLGRGYSVGTNSFQSTCLMIDEVTTPSYNYDYAFHDFTDSETVESELTGTVSLAFAYWMVKAEVNIAAKTSGKSMSRTRIVVATMRIERYYSSIREEISPLSEDALTLLDVQDYIGFFKSCGPNYVRSIRRAQELTALFKFTSSSEENAREFALGLKASGAGLDTSAEFASKEKYTSITSNLAITIVAYGLGLNAEGSSQLVSRSLEEYNDVMKFAFQSFTQNEDSHNIGMVYGIEIVPWVDNTAFQIASKVLDEEVEIELPRSLQRKAVYTDNPDELWTVAKNDDAATGRDVFFCADLTQEIDRFGYCCEISSLYDPVLKIYPKPELAVRGTGTELVCNPVRKLDKSVVKNNMSNNGEFVTHLDSLVRFKLNQLYFLEKCLITVNAFDLKYDYHVLKPKDSVRYDVNVEASFSVKELRLTLDPGGDYGMVTHLGKELDEFIEMYYSPCIAELFGTHQGSTPDVEPQYFMAFSWLTHDACAKLSCLADNMRWDRRDDATNVGCVPSLIVGAGHSFYGISSDNCAKDNDVSTFTAATESCKHDETEFYTYQMNSETCWGDTVPDYLMNHFCMPQLSGKILEDGSDEKTALTTKVTACASTGNQGNPNRRLSGENDNLKPRQANEKLQDTVLKSYFTENETTDN